MKYALRDDFIVAYMEREGIDPKDRMAVGCIGSDGVEMIAIASSVNSEGWVMTPTVDDDKEAQLVKGINNADAITSSASDLIVSVADLLPGDVLLYRAKGMKPHQKKISKVTCSPYTHAAIYLGNGQIADSNFPRGVAKHSVQESIKSSLCVAVLRSQLGFGHERPDLLNEFVDCTIANGRFYDLIGAIEFGSAKKHHDENQLDFIRCNYGKVTSSDDFARRSFFCSAFIVACYSVVGVIGPSAQVAYVPNSFSPGNLHQDPSFGWVLGYIVPEEGNVPNDDPILNQGTLWRDLQECRWW